MPQHLRFFFEAGVSGTPLRPDDIDSPYGSPCELDLLPISPAVRIELARLCEWFQSSIDREYPPGPSPWPEQQWELFTQQADAALEILCHELGEGWIVEDRRRPS
jgi:hypothetical protein